MAESEDVWDGLAGGYDAWYQMRLGRVAGACEWKALVSLSRPSRGSRALEAGVGTGYFAARLAALNAQVVGVDLSMPMLRQAQAKGLPLHLLRADAAALPLAAEAFDVVYTVTMLEFVAEPRQALDEMWRVLKPGGRMVVGVLNACSPWAERREPPFDRAHYYTPEELKSILAPYGPVQLRSTVFFRPNGRLLRWARGLEGLGRAFGWLSGALLMAAVVKASSESLSAVVVREPEARAPMAFGGG
ncbi:MAG: class I SAM-dependent methyltransferase [Anaerolineae bacterium]